MFLLKVVEALHEHGVPYAITGGYAVSLHGAVRGTLDVDLVIPQTLQAYRQTESALRSIGLQCRLPVTAEEVFRFRREFIQKRNMVAWTFSNPDRPAELVDIIITEDLRKLGVRKLSFGRHRLRIVAMDDLIRIKQKSDRPQDQADVKALTQLKSLRKK